MYWNHAKQGVGKSSQKAMSYIDFIHREGIISYLTATEELREGPVRSVNCYNFPRLITTIDSQDLSENKIGFHNTDNYI